MLLALIIFGANYTRFDDFYDFDDLGGKWKLSGACIALIFSMLFAGGATVATIMNFLKPKVEQQ